jgi:hypothetical protein
VCVCARFATTINFFVITFIPLGFDAGDGDREEEASHLKFKSFDFSFSRLLTISSSWVVVVVSCVLGYFLVLLSERKLNSDGIFLKRICKKLKMMKINSKKYVKFKSLQKCKKNTQ